jgi:hypothetical protein
MGCDEKQSSSGVVDREKLFLEAYKVYINERRGKKTSQEAIRTVVIHICERLDK